jgi:hypothetical protein
MQIWKINTVFVMLLMGLVIAGCGSTGQTQTKITDNGKPGQIKAIVFYDANRNGTQDQGEPGLTDNVSISQDVSCPPSNLKNISRADSDTTGVAVFSGLKPGRYCVAYMGTRGLTTKLTDLVDLSSEQEIQVVFGASEN